MQWLELAVYTTDAGTELVCGALSGAGVDMVSIEESRERAMAFLNERAVYWDFADAEHIGTDTPCVKAYLADVPESLETLARVKAAIHALKSLDTGIDAGPLTLVVNRVCDEDWANNWKAYYKPLPIGSRLLVLPSWEPEPAGHGRTVLRLDPGVAFGTGSHHTTRMCVEFLEQAVKPGCRMLDLGCGSGILSIAALLMGAREAVAVDIDPVAEHIAAENAALNGVDPANYHVHIGDLITDAALCERIAGAYDVVCANIVADVILAIAPFARRCVKPGAPLIVSGVIDERADEVAAGLEALGFAVRQTARAEGWVAMLLTGGNGSDHASIF